MAAILLLGLLFGGFYWRTRQLWPVVFAHAVADFVGLSSLG
jgi:membrane protease YdiL (CAAX protease family)